MGASYAGNIRKADLLADTPYNTYTRAGLPPTPIAMPGVAALQAATHPASGDALYFVAVGDGSGRHVFTRSLAEHQAAVRQYLQRYRAHAATRQHAMTAGASLPPMHPHFVSHRRRRGRRQDHGARRAARLPAGRRLRSRQHARARRHAAGRTHPRLAAGQRQRWRSHETLWPETELLLMFAARAQHVRETILPALERGAWVISDRFTDSSYAYQGGGRGLDPELIAQLERRVVPVRPALTLLLDVGVGIGRERTRGRDLALSGSGPDRIERERDEFFERVRSTFLARAAAEPSRIRVIDAVASGGRRRGRCRGACCRHGAGNEQRGSGLLALAAARLRASRRRRSTAAASATPCWSVGPRIWASARWPNGSRSARCAAPAGPTAMLRTMPQLPVVRRRARNPDYGVVVLRA